MIEHPIPPLYDKNSRVLILGSFPSVKSREQRFFYGHPQNRFWRVIARIFDKEVPESLEEKKKLLYSMHIAVWDVIAACDISGSSDSSIRNVVPNDLKIILDNADIKQVFVNGKTAEKYFKKFIGKSLNIEAVCLPSTSPANAARSFESLVEEWNIIKKYIN